MFNLIPRDRWEYHPGDFFRSLSVLFSSRDSREHVSLSELGNGIPIASGRAALFTALKALQLPPPAKIGVPLYCCPVVFQSIVLAGHTPVFVDVEENTFCLSPENLSAKQRDLDAVIAVHMFGNICNIPRLEAIAPGKPFIEDCAQSLGSQLDGRAAGSFGTISIFSFRSGKYISAGEGGAVYSSNPATYSALEQEINAFRSPTLLQELSHAVKICLKSLLRNKPLYGLVGYRLWERVNKDRNISAKSNIALHKIYRTDLAVAKSRLAFLNSTIEAHRKNAGTYSEKLKIKPAMLCLEPSGALYNRLQYPIILPSKECRDTIVAALLSRGIDSIKYLDDIVEIASASYGYSGGCPVSERLAKTVLIIPNYESLRQRDVEHIIQSLNAISMQTNGAKGVLPKEASPTNTKEARVVPVAGSQTEVTMHGERKVAVSQEIP